MKRLFTVTIAVILVLTMIIPSMAAAQTNTKIELKQAIEIAKKTFDIPDSGYDFNSNYSENNNRKTWSLNWNLKNNRSISVNVDADTGEILNYNFYTPANGPVSRIPKYTKDEAKKAAIDFINKIAPNKLKETKEQDFYNGIAKPYYDNNEYFSSVYNFNFVRLVNGIPFQENQISVSVDKNTLKVQSYYLNWNNNYTFPDINASISKEKALQIFKDKIGLKLQYNLVYSDIYDNKEQKPQAILVYGITNNSPIDATTGDIVYQDYYGTMYGGGGNMGMSSSKQNLSPQEQKAVDDTTKYINKDKALESAKNSLPFEIGPEYLLQSANLYNGYPYGTNAYWNFNWNYNKDNNYYFINASVDAVTGELKFFYRGGSDIDNVQSKELKYTKDQLKKIVEDYLNKVQPDKFKQVEYQDRNIKEDPNHKMPYIPFDYVEKVNGILCPFNTFSVSVSPYSGDITNFYMNWTNVNLPAADNAIKPDDAYKVLLDNSEFGLNYIAYYNPTNDGPQKPEIKLVYQLTNFNGFIDAKTGTLLDYSGKPIVKDNQVVFTDIKGHWAEKDIALLVQYGIADGKDNKFSPDENILQKDFIKMLVKSIQPVYEPIPLNSNNDYDNYYNAAIQRNIIKVNEKNPDSLVTRQDAAKFLVRSFGVNFIADLNDIYTLNFKDTDKIDSSLKGYIAIASGLKIMTGENGYFYPQNYITRAQTASMLVRYLRLER